MTSSQRPEDITLYSWPYSDCSTRLRIALNLKNLPYNLVSISLSDGERPHFSINPSQTVPTLILHNAPDGGGELTLTQSVAALECLDDAFPETVQLLPADARNRARVRTMVNAIAVDVHPLTTHRVNSTIVSMFPCEATAEAKQSGNNIIREWELHWIRRGLHVYEDLLEYTGKYSVGDTITMADVCLVPQVWTARRFGINVEEEFSDLARIVRRLEKVEAVAKEFLARGSQ